MKTQFTVIAFYLLCSCLNAQSEQTIEGNMATLKKEVQNLQNELQKTKNNTAYLSSEVSSMNQLISSQGLRIENLQKSIEEKQDTINKMASELGRQIDATGDKASKGIDSLYTSMRNNMRYWVVAFLAIAILSSLAYFLLKKRISSDKSLLVQQIADTKKNLEEEGINLDNKLVDILDKQLKLISMEKPATSNGNGEEDHSLALKVADEITRIQMNLGHMDPSTKGLKQLGRAVGAIIDNFQANGYEIPELLNKPYDQGMNLVATMEPDENLEPGKQIIKRIIKPQINYKGVMVQAAQVVVAFGE
jgi:peptidoglycan hydrolase CwlO-like protein